jgi:hypothetical protein
VTLVVAAAAFVAICAGWIVFLLLLEWLGDLGL